MKFNYEDILKDPNMITREVIDDLDRILYPHNIYHYVSKTPYIRCSNNTKIIFIFNWENHSLYFLNEEIANILNKISDYFMEHGLNNRKTKRSLIFEYNDLYNYLFVKKLKGDSCIL